MTPFLVQVAVATIRVLGACAGAFLLFGSIFAFNGALASELPVPPSLTERILAGLAFAVPGATLLVPVRVAVTRRAWTHALLLAYFISVAVWLVEPLQTDSFSVGQAWLPLVVALNLLAFWQYRRTYNDV